MRVEVQDVAPSEAQADVLALPLTDGGALPKVDSETDKLLSGLIGDGEISAFQPQPDGTFLLVGQLRTSEHKVLTIDGLWSLQFGKGAPNNGPTTTLFFTAGPNGEADGLFGTITAG